MAYAIAKNGLLALVSVIASLGIIELAAYPALLRDMPTNLMSINGRYGQLLAQSSKAGIVPRDYILITGDSISVGVGDALSNARPGSREPYASAHFIANRLGRDVLSIGRSGWSTVSGSLAPVLFAEQAAVSWRFPMPAPAALVYYFFEGNDLSDNRRWAISLGVEINAGPLSTDAIDGLLDRQRARDHALPDRLERFVQANLPATVFMMGALRRIGARPRRARPYDVGAVPPGHVNRAVMTEGTGRLTNELVAPPMAMSETAWSNAVSIARQALTRLARAFPGAPVTIVYVPSPATSYELATDPVATWDFASSGRRVAMVPADAVRAAHVRLRGAICAIARDAGYAFIDASPAIRLLARERLLHGPADWGHFNLDGYRALGTIVADGLGAQLRGPDPGECT